MRTIVAMIAALVTVTLSGCSLAPFIRTDIVDYNQSVTDATNRLLLINILRARDRAPLLFSAVQLVHGSLQLGGQTSFSVPFGNGKLKNPNTTGIVLSAQVAPTFDVSSLDTQDFTRGILKPIDPAVVKYFLDRGDIDPKIVLLLFFAEIRNESGDVVRIDAESPLGIRTALAALATGKVRGTSNIIANAYTELTRVGVPYKAKQLASLKDVTSIDQTKYRLLGDPHEQGQFALYAVSPIQQIAFCLRIETNGSTRFVTLGNVFNAEVAEASENDPRCTKTEVFIDKERDHQSPSRARRGYDTVVLRSVEGMIQFLGGILRYENAHGGMPVTFAHFIRAANDGAPAPEAFGTNTSDIFFDLDDRPSSAMFDVSYRGGQYYAHSNDISNNDHTLEVLALLSKLLDMNKVAKELPVTQSVQIVP